MNFSQMHDRLRVELLRRIQRGTLSVSLLSRQTGFGQSHVSNFLHSRGSLSLAALDRVLSAQNMAVEDLIQLHTHNAAAADTCGPDLVPLVSHTTALFEPIVRPSAAQMMLQLPPGTLRSLRAKTVASRRTWQRFVAIRVDHADALPMEPLLHPNAIAVIDRHYNALVPYRATRPNLLAVRDGARLTLRYVEYASMRLVLRPLNIAFPVDLIEIGPENSPGEFIAGRVALILNEL
jgi:hypothetical protein